MPDQAPDRQVREFAAAFRGFLDWIHSPAAGAGEGNEVWPARRRGLDIHLPGPGDPAEIEKPAHRRRRFTVAN